ncbi:hypothetical protein [Cellulomonas sp. Root485]|uniref:hypothetical protein n=1 Tax=Cellulomonas sp. Root485 TaxID=1736546 RepID=UPI000AC93400|nr:hypothetical protein [Cellulomonas sp. Root485]
MGALKNQMIDTANAHAFLPRSVAPTTFRFQGIALPIGGSALEPIGGSKRRTATDPRTYLIRTPMI